MATFRSPSPGRVGARTRLVRSWWPLADHGRVIGCLIADNSQPLARAGEVAQEVLHWRAGGGGAGYFTGFGDWGGGEGANLRPRPFNGPQWTKAPPVVEHSS